MVAISYVANLGINLASTLEVCSEGYDQLPKLITLIYSTAFTLGKIDGLITENGKAFNQTGMADIESLTITCQKIFTGILIMLVRKTSSIDRDKKATEISGEKLEMLLSCASKLYTMSYESRNWLKLRLRYCEHLLTQIKLELKLRHLLGSIANHQLKTTSRVPGSFQTEISLIDVAGDVARKWRRHHKHISKKMAIWEKVDSPASSINSSSETIADARFGRPPPAGAPSTPCSIATTAWDIDTNKSSDTKPMDLVVSTKIKTVGLNDDIETPAKAREDERTTDRGIEKPDKTLLAIAKSWLKKMLSESDQDEWKNEDLEVWQLPIRMEIESATLQPIERVKKLDMSDRQIRYLLTQLTSYRKKKNKSQLIEQYVSLDRRLRFRIDGAIGIVERSGMREKTWIAMSSEPFKKATGKGSQVVVQAEMNILLFFRLGQVPEPIYVIDIKGRKSELPYNLCTSLQMIPSIMPDPSWILNVHGHIIQASGQYRLYTEDWLPVGVATWETVRRPGMSLMIKPAPPGLSTIRPGGTVPPGHWRPPPNIITVQKPTQPRSPNMPWMRSIHYEMKEMLQTSYPLFPNEDVFKAGLGNLLGLWTNAIDCHLDDDVLSGSGTSSSSSSSAFPSTSGSDSSEICD
ncbi:hypothetical protein ACHAPU_000768 [Fusarium lateritium]